MQNVVSRKKTATPLGRGGGLLEEVVVVAIVVIIVVVIVIVISIIEEVIAAFALVPIGFAIPILVGIIICGGQEKVVVLGAVIVLATVWAKFGIIVCCLSCLRATVW